MTANLEHITVLGEEVVQNVVKKKDGIYVDATFGGGGHSKLILDVLGEEGRLIAFDIDDEAVARGKKLEEVDSRFKIIKCNFADISRCLSDLGISAVDGMVFDLGMSTFQLLSPERGFSFKYEESILDMRMNQSHSISAADVLSYFSRDKLTHIFKRYGEINNPVKLVSNISLYRKQHGGINTISDFLDVIEISWDKKIDYFKFLTKCFQAVRIEVNQELESLELALDSLQKIVNKNGVVAIITFHSLEDEKIKDWKRKFCDTIQIPDYGQNKANKFSLINKGCIVPNMLEKMNNWSSRSAKLWLVQKN